MQLRLSYAISGLLLLVSAYTLSYAYINNDVSWHIYVAMQILDGQVLYRDIIEINPPLVYYLRILPVWLATLLDTSAMDWVHTATFLWIVLSLYLVHRIRPDGVSLTLATFALAIIPLVLYIQQFSQKEHLFIIGALPYLLLPYSTHALSDRMRWVIGISAAFGFLLKPYFFLCFFCVEGYYWLTQRRVTLWHRPESKAVILLSIGYVLWVFVFFHDYLFGIIAELGQWYFYYRMPIDHYLLIKAIFHIWLFLIPLILLPFSTVSRGQWYLLVQLVCCIFLVLLQFKGWQYHAYPSMVIALFLGTSLLTKPSFSTLLSRPLAPIVSIIFVILLLLNTYQGWGNTFYNKRAEPAFLVKTALTTLKQVAPEARTLWVMSEKLIYGFPLTLYGNYQWGSRFSNLWLLTALENYRSKYGTYDPFAKQYLYSSVLEDMDRFQPDIILIDVYKGLPLRWDNTPLNYKDYLSKNPYISKPFEDYTFVTYIDDATHKPRFSVYKHKRLRQ